MKHLRWMAPLLAVLAVLPRESSARLGETVAQSDQRYGAPTSVKSSFLVLSGVPNREYSYRGWRITAAFIKGKTAKVRYSKAGGKKIEDDEWQAVLKGEAHGGEWTEKSQSSLNPAMHLQNLFTRPRLWTNSNGCVAYFENPQYLSFVVEAPIVEKYKQAQEAQRERQRKAAIPDF